MTRRVAVLAASFSLREQEPNPCNQRLAAETVRICKQFAEAGDLPIVVAQWEVGLALREHGQFRTNLRYGQVDAETWAFGEIGQFDDGRYLGTKEVYEEARRFFHLMGATHFVAVANPFIHQPYLYWLARKHYKLVFKRVRRIGFDKQSTQWWCRSWWKLLIYTVQVALFKKHGYNNRQAQA